MSTEAKATKPAGPIDVTMAGGLRPSGRAAHYIHGEIENVLEVLRAAKGYWRVSSESLESVKNQERKVGGLPLMRIHVHSLLTITHDDWVVVTPSGKLARFDAGSFELLFGVS